MMTNGNVTTEIIAKKVEEVSKKKDHLFVKILLFVGVLVFIVSILAVTLYALNVLKNSGFSITKSSSSQYNSKYAPVHYDPLSLSPFLQEGKKVTELAVVLGASAGVLGFLALIIGSLLMVVRKSKNVKIKTSPFSLIISLIFFTLISLILASIAIYYGVSTEIKGLNDFLILKNKFTNQFQGILLGAGKAYADKMNLLEDNGFNKIAAMEAGQTEVFKYLGVHFPKFANDFVTPELSKYVSKYGYQAGGEVYGIVNASLGISNRFLTVENLPRLGINLGKADGFNLNDVVLLTSYGSGGMISAMGSSVETVFKNHPEIINNINQNVNHFLNNIENQLYTIVTI